MCHGKCQVLWAFCESQFNVNFQNEIKERERDAPYSAGGWCLQRYSESLSYPSSSSLPNTVMIGRANDMGSAAPPVHRGDWGSAFLQFCC